MSETALSSPSTEMDPQTLAEATVQAMYPRDNASQALGMKILEIAPGRARMSMLVRSDMLNGHATCHGGFIFALADSSFAFACNSRNLNTVASGCSIDYVAPAMRNDVLIAEAQERTLAGRTGVYDITVSNQDGKIIALFRGKSYRIRGEVISGLQAAQ
ncbi:phenylacetic acid degradation protein [Herbaspirillum sp. GW103]|uniref:hydroxyphenylacetyl-CoA thioesterase PaaI n=1 Tax=unclassified Herbaspirillum TaxID=2624150 RepID=UPI00025E2F23|nr:MULTISPECIES: hydroxyphenylacetyl-CoA thioesterase PaaI [unclassified Herbaspirillum]EIJ45236.1 phenylacetic acid degradation protein [Herbaspirillum sp. GW103]MCI1004113.1 hydroxyphenylacetyl-CoA thioesterase PaaI [Herbaspirillum sp. C7C8]